MLPVPGGYLEYLVTGAGAPVTIFAHGLAGSIDTTRPFGTAVGGQQVYLHFRGHGASSSPETPWTYGYLADELDAVARHTGATQALGVSMGAGAICNLIERVPARFDRIVLALPAVTDHPRRDAALERLVAMATLADDRDVDGLAEQLVLEQPAEVRHTAPVQQWCREQARLIVQTDVSRALRSIPHLTALQSLDSLHRVQTPVLVIAQEDDPAHPVWVGRELAAALPNARLEVLPPGGIMWTHRARVRSLVGEFLTTPHR
ncbi:alpha/beta hydrolase [Calidifontibacter sp. DB0510]|uniref:Alpha/beta hydrolase n=1 Tax=Metallococcus carri TaxID=1656884 RepID=A0A967B131_9MICO|nr:alpha/beta hydrolase [Metallococcus carri]NOP38303.1 alpha/beta hydrolase [Calidifontibacter sp. DB2511S]